MRVFFTCSSEGLIKNFGGNKEITEHIKKFGHEITYDWIGKAYQEIKNGIIGDTERYYEEKIKGIKEADILIVEGSHKSFSVGHQISIALGKSKPILFLYSTANKLKKHYLEGIKSPWLVKKGYLDTNEAFSQIEDFLALYQKGKKYRFNLVLTQEENKFLEKLMRVRQKTKTDIIRDLIQKSMKELETFDNSHTDRSLS